LNSGVQIRSRSSKEFNNERVHGPQVEIETAPGSSGYIYGEATGRGWLSPTRDITDAYQNDQWNTFRVLAVGPRVQTWINGRMVADLTDEASSQFGFIGLQVHGVGEKGPFEVRWRNIKIKDLAPEKTEKAQGTQFTPAPDASQQAPKKPQRKARKTAKTAKTADIVAAGAEVELLAGDFLFTEGPACDADGNVYFTDQPNDRILKWSVDGQLSTFMQPSGRSNGLCFDAKGNLWACADEKNELWCISPAGNVEVVVKEYAGKLLNAPNDLWIRPDGGIYFSDPFYKRDYWKRGPSEQDVQAVYYLPPDRKTLVRVADDLTTPNGLIGTPDGKKLYVADLGAKKTYLYDVQPDGTLQNKRLFCSMGSDGMTIDDEGNVYLTGQGVTVFNTEGVKIREIPIAGGWTANVCFGGKDRQTLFITATKSLYGLRMRVRGVDSQ
ncbi:MAG: DUF1080 domain-containing protein, partial [Planctomycetes bacterium]|nr:DUF1080 domain-containing protein [Planctomycetota bacterium]